MAAPLPPRRPRPAPTFRPQFTLTVVYLFGFFMLYALMLIAPTMIESYRALPPGASQEDLELASDIARRAARPRLWIAGVAALASVALGSYTGVLPGTRR